MVATIILENEYTKEMEEKKKEKIKAVLELAKIANDVDFVLIPKSCIRSYNTRVTAGDNVVGGTLDLIFLLEDEEHLRVFRDITKR